MKENKFFDVSVLPAFVIHTYFETTLDSYHISDELYESIRQYIITEMTRKGLVIVQSADEMGAFFQGCPFKPHITKAYGDWFSPYGKYKGPEFYIQVLELTNRMSEIDVPCYRVEIFNTNDFGTRENFLHIHEPYMKVRAKSPSGQRWLNGIGPFKSVTEAFDYSDDFTSGLTDYFQSPYRVRLGTCLNVYYEDLSSDSEIEEMKECGLWNDERDIVAFLEIPFWEVEFWPAPSGIRE